MGTFASSATAGCRLRSRATNGGGLAAQCDAIERMAASRARPLYAALSRKTGGLVDASGGWAVGAKGKSHLRAPALIQTIAHAAGQSVCSRAAALPEGLTTFGR